jgi:hypothetical protein
MAMVCEHWDQLQPGTIEFRKRRGFFGICRSGFEDCVKNRVDRVRETTTPTESNIMGIATVGAIFG